MSKTFWAILAAIVIIFFGIVTLNKPDEGSSANGAQPTNHLVGSDSTGVKLVEYGDFQCSFCGQYYPLVKQVTEQYKDKIQFQFRHLPLIQVHQNAMAASRAAEAAGLQGKFWEMYDLIFQAQSSWSESTSASRVFEGYATQLGLDLARFKTDVASRAVNNTINADIAEFKKTKEPMSTPTFFLDGKKIQPKTLDEFSQLIDAAIAAKANTQPAQPAQ